MRDNALFYTCSLIEYIGRAKHQKRDNLVNRLGITAVRRIYKYSDVLHCEPIEKISDEYITMMNLEEGDYDNIAKCKYNVPDYWDIGDVYSRLITDVDDGDVIETLFKVYNSNLSDEILDYNSAMYFQPRDYLKMCYLAESGNA